MEKKNIQVLPENECSGCGACDNCCPVQAIAMEENQDGFLYPCVKEAVCTGCGRCIKVCPVLTLRQNKDKKPLCYAAYASDEVRMKSSSGGLFTVLANYVLEKKGYVCGAAFNENFAVEHRIISEENELEQFRGSKYVQSKIGFVFRQIRELLEAGEYVLFTGVPCQVAGLLGYLKQDYERLLTIDVICHGVPAPGVFRKYIKEKYGVNNIKAFQFRTKEFGHSCTNCVVTLKNGRRIVGNVDNDPYEKGFHRSLILRDSCGNCKFAPLPRQGDITLGDFWGIDKYNPDYADARGVSVVLINSDRGSIVWNEIKPTLPFAKAVPLEFALKHNRYRSKRQFHEGRADFFRLNRRLPFEKAVKMALNEKFSFARSSKRFLKKWIPQKMIEKLRG